MSVKLKVLHGALKQQGKGLTEREKRFKKARAKRPPKQKQPMKLPKKPAFNVNTAIDESLRKFGRGVEKQFRRR